MQQAKTTALESSARREAVEVGKKPSAAMTHTCGSGMAFGCCWHPSQVLFKLILLILIDFS